MIAMEAKGKSAQEIGAMGVWTSNWSMHIAASDPIANPRPTNSAKSSRRLRNNLVVTALNSTWEARYASAFTARKNGTSLISCTTSTYSAALKAWPSGFVLRMGVMVSFT